MVSADLNTIVWLISSFDYPSITFFMRSIYSDEPDLQCSTVPIFSSLCIKLLLNLCLSSFLFSSDHILVIDTSFGSIFDYPFLILDILFQHRSPTQRQIPSTFTNMSTNTFATQSDMVQRINIGGLRLPTDQERARISQLSARPQLISIPQLPIQTSFGSYGSYPSPAAFQQQPFFPSPGVAATNCFPPGAFPHQQPLHNLGRSQPTFSSGVAAFSGFPAGVFANQQPQYHTPGRPQPVYAPGVAATNCFPTGASPHQLQYFPQAQTYGGQYSQNAFTAPVQGPWAAQNVASTAAPPAQQEEQYFDLTRDDEEEVRAPTLAPACPVVPVSAAQDTGLLTPADTPSSLEAPSVPEAPCHLGERVKHLQLTIRESYEPCAFRLFRSFMFMNIKQQREYCSLFWPSNEEAYEEILRASKLSLDFSTIYYLRLSLTSKLKEAKSEEEREKLEEETEVICAEMERTCKAKLQDRRDEENLSNLHQAVTTTKGKKSKASRAAQLEVWNEENVRVQEAKQERWAKLDGQQTSTSLAGQKRKQRVQEEPNPAPKKRGRPPKARAAEDVAVVKEKKKRGRPRKSPVVQKPTPEHAIDEAEDDGALEAALYAGLCEDVVGEEEDGSSEAAPQTWLAADDSGVVDDSAEVEPSGRVQMHDEDDRVAGAVAEDRPEEVRVDESAAVIVSSSQEHGQEEEGCDEDSLFGDSLFEDFELGNLLDTGAANDIGATLDGMFF